MSRRSIYRIIPVILCFVAIFWFSSIPSDVLAYGARPLINKTPQNLFIHTKLGLVQINLLKTGHFIGYALLGATLWYGLAHLVQRPWLWAIVVATIFAITDELHQAKIPGRSAMWQDVVLDVCAAALAIVLLVMAQRRKSALSQKP